MAEGPVVEHAEHRVAVPVYAAGVLRGGIIANFAPEQDPDLDDFSKF